MKFPTIFTVVCTLILVNNVLAAPTAGSKQSSSSGKTKCKRADEYLVGYRGTTKETAANYESGNWNRAASDASRGELIGPGIYVTGKLSLAEHWSKDGTVCFIYAKDEQTFKTIPKVWLPADLHGQPPIIDPTGQNPAYKKLTQVWENKRQKHAAEHGVHAKVGHFLKFAVDGGVPEFVIPHDLDKDFIAKCYSGEKLKEMAKCHTDIDYKENAAAWGIHGSP
ncbi:hypothetical protein FISHEDRAFT_57785 [Fistulina hepatica ATCC 64428]|uniref:Uncharacterized protein n=1 Tax=Fistulina hepatica ATCC 64428 TaxID=1128425 RepID=A0A0D7AGV0_9AGAR|nr:hypothetical protein FISHEDRAFT_57785 [Fistulina hepatica ATCC 64428]